MRRVLPLLGPELEQKGEHHEPHRLQASRPATSTVVGTGSRALARLGLWERQRRQQSNACAGYGRCSCNRCGGGNAGADDHNRGRC